MRLFCWFAQCRWLHVANVTDDDMGCLNNFGLWQCSRCKTLSVGRYVTETEKREGLMTARSTGGERG